MAKQKKGGRVTTKLPSIVTGENDPALRGKSIQVAAEDFDSKLNDLIKVMFRKLATTRGVGLAANQIGRTESVFVYEFGSDRGYFVNPTLEEVGDSHVIAPEGCLSLPHLGDQMVSRPKTATVSGFTRHNTPVLVRAEGMLARVFIHEMEHLEGGLYIDQL